MTLNHPGRRLNVNSQTFTGKHDENRRSGARLMRNNYLILAGLILVLTAVVLSATVEGSIYQKKGYSNGGPSSGSLQQWSTEGSNVMRFGTVNTSENYQAASYQFTTLGKTGYAIETESGDSYSGSIDISSTGMLNLFETGAMADYQANVPDSICDQNGFLVGDNSSGQYPSSQSVEYLAGTMASGSSRYKSGTGIADTTVIHEATAAADNGYYYMDLKGDLKVGFDKNSSVPNLAYGVHDHIVSRSNETAKLAAGFEYGWNGYEVEEEEETYTVTSISSGRLDEYVNETNQTAE